MSTGTNLSPLYTIRSINRQKAAAHPSLYPLRPGRQLIFNQTHRVKSGSGIHQIPSTGCHPASSSRPHKTCTAVIQQKYGLPVIFNIIPTKHGIKTVRCFHVTLLRLHDRVLSIKADYGFTRFRRSPKIRHSGLPSLIGFHFPEYGSVTSYLFKTKTFRRYGFPIRIFPGHFLHGIRQTYSQPPSIILRLPVPHDSRFFRYREGIFRS